jgi:hypothetical protein
LLLPDCFRKSDFKSSLNQVHLRIYHALKETSQLTDAPTMTGSGGMATTIGNYVLGHNPGIPLWSGQPDGRPGRMILRPSFTTTIPAGTLDVPSEKLTCRR